MQFHEKTAVVTGAAQGIGAATARAFATAGAAVAVLDLKETEGEAIAAAIRDRGGRAIFCRTDVTDEAQYQAALAKIAEAFGGVDILVNNAVSSVRIPLSQLPVEGWQKTLEVGLLGLTRQMAQEFANAKIRVNAVCPGLILTEGNRHLWPPERLKRVLPFYPIGRVGQPEDVANTILFLASDLAGFITGVALPVDGGMLSKGADVTVFQ